MLSDGVLSKRRVKKLLESSEPLDGIKKSLYNILYFKPNPDGENYNLYKSKKLLDEVPVAYFKSFSFQLKEKVLPIELLDHYVMTLAVTKGVLPRVNRTKMVLRELFITDLSTYLFESNPNIGAICFFGSFVRGRVNPHDIDIVVYFKRIDPALWRTNCTGSWDGPKSEKLKAMIRGNEQPDEKSQGSFHDMDETFYLIEKYQKNSPLFKELATQNNYSEAEKKEFRINPIVMPYAMDFSASNISGGNFWIINSEIDRVYRSFFSLGREFNKNDSKIHVP